MAGVAPQRLDRVPEHRRDHGEELLDRLRAAGEVDDQRAVRDAGGTAIGISAPGEIGGVAQMPIEGESFARSITDP